MGAAKRIPKSNNNNNDYSLILLDLCGTVMSKVGLKGFIVIVCTLIYFIFIPQNLKDEITKTWILFKGEHSDVIAVFVIISLLLLFCVQWWYYHQAIKLKDKRIEEISKEKAELQEILLERKLKSTKK